MTLTAVEVEKPYEIEQVRYIRNICRDGFSNHTDYISWNEHLTFWKRAQPLAWLYLADEGGPFPVCVGFGLLRKDEQGRWVTVVAVLPEQAGHGYGKQITHDIVTKAPGPCYATARKDNPAAVKLHDLADWEVTGEDERLVYFRTKERVVA